MIPHPLRIAPGLQHGEIISGEPVTYSFKYDVIKGNVAAPNPVSFTYSTLLSLSGDIEDEHNQKLPVDNQIYETVNGDTVRCKYYYTGGYGISCSK